MPAVPNTNVVSILAGLVASMLTGVKVHLYTAVANPIGPGSILADFTEATYTGYVVKTVTFGAPYLNGAGMAESDSPLMTFVDTGTAVGNIIAGFYVTDAAGTTLLWAGPLPAPVSMLNPLDAVALILPFVLAPPPPPY